MFPWMNPWFYGFKSPLSGDVEQNISPVTSWFTQDLEFNFAGNKSIEAEVISEVASYGKQLGILTEAVMELAEGKRGASVDKLEAIAANIEQIKQRHKNQLSEKAHTVLKELQKTDPDLLQQILEDFTKK